MNRPFCLNNHMKSAEEKVVLVLHHYRGDIWDAEYAGLRRYCRAYNWGIRDLCFPGRIDPDRVRRILDKEKVVGIIASLAKPIPEDILEKQPVVCLDCEEPGRNDGCPYICHDSERTAHLAVRELSSLSLRNFAYVHDSRGLHWSHARCDAFVREVSARGGSVSEPFSMPGVRDGRVLVSAMARWAEALPKPCGVFAANDETAALLLRACHKAGIGVPDDVAVVGVDNRQSICDATTPTLSSVAPDWEAGAFMVASLIDRMTRGRRTEMHGTFRPLGLIRRESTASASGKVNERVVKAVGLIRAKACEGLGARDVARDMGCSRRLAELRFREVTGKSILEEIRRVRYENAEKILSQTQAPLGVVANMSGWASVTTFCREFKAVFGMSPMEWRRKNVADKAKAR